MLFYKSSDEKQVKLLDCLLMNYFGHRILSGFFLLPLERYKIGNSVMMKKTGIQWKELEFWHSFDDTNT